MELKKINAIEKLFIYRNIPLKMRNVPIIVLNGYEVDINAFLCILA